MPDGVNIDWGLAGQPVNAFGSYQTGYALGRKAAGDQVQGNAMQAYATDPTAPIDPQLAAASPETFLALQQAQAGAKSRVADQTAAQKLGSGDYAGAAATPGLSLEQVQALQAAHAKMTTDQLAQAAKTHEIFANAAAGLMANVPMAPGADPNAVMAERKAQAIHTLQTAGYPQAIIDAAGKQDYSDTGLSTTATSNIEAGKQAEMALEAKKDAETARHNQADEGETATYHAGQLKIDQGKLGVEQGQLHVAQRRLALDSASSLTPEAVDYAAHDFLTNGGKMPALGRTSGDAQKRIMNRVAEIQASTGQTAQDAALTHASIKAGSAALTAQTKKQTFLETNAAEASRMGDLALSLAAKGGGTTGAPVVNRWIQAGRKSLAGDADVNNFNIAMGGFAEKYAQVMTGNTTNAPATDSARHTAAERLATYASQGQLQGGMATMRREMEIQRQANQEATDKIRASIAAHPSAAAPGGARQTLTDIFK